MISLMAHNWLDQRALDIINKPPKFVSEDPIPIDVSDDESDQSVSRVYDKSRVQIQLPNTDQSEELQYLPPTLPPNEPKGSISNVPHFICPDEHFDVFENFNFSWINAPELDKK